MEFSFGTDTVYAVNEYTTVEALARNAEEYARLAGEYAARVASDGSDPSGF